MIRRNSICELRNPAAGRQGCIDPVNFCSDVIVEGHTDEHPDYDEAMLVLRARKKLACLLGNEDEK